MSMTLQNLFEWLYYSAQWWEPFLIDGTAIVLAGSAIGIGISLRRIAFGWKPKKKQKANSQGEQISQKDAKKQKKPERKEESFGWESDGEKQEEVDAGPMDENKSQVTRREKSRDINPSPESRKEKSASGEQVKKKEDEEQPPNMISSTQFKRILHKRKPISDYV